MHVHLKKYEAGHCLAKTGKDLRDTVQTKNPLPMLSRDLMSAPAFTVSHNKCCLRHTPNTALEKNVKTEFSLPSCLEASEEDWVGY